MLTADLYDAFNDVGFKNAALLKDIVSKDQVSNFLRVDSDTYKIMVNSKDQKKF